MIFLFRRVNQLIVDCMDITSTNTIGFCPFQGISFSHLLCGLVWLDCMANRKYLQYCLWVCLRSELSKNSDCFEPVCIQREHPEDQKLIWLTHREWNHHWPSLGQFGYFKFWNAIFLIYLSTMDHPHFLQEPLMQYITYYEINKLIKSF